MKFMPMRNKPLRAIAEWISIVNDSGSAFYDRLNEIYGDNEAARTEAAKMCLRTLEEFSRIFGDDRPVMVIRSTGRVNLLGTHIDHRGGAVNSVAIKQIWAVVQGRGDDRVLVKNIESEQFQDEEFCISQCLPNGKNIQDWEAWCCDEFEKRQGNKSITWSNYVRSAVLYFQHLNTADDGTFTAPLQGMNMMFYGNVPRAAGLSSSSSIVMLAAEAVMQLNGIEMTPIEVVEHCGYAEWYVGTRGGCGDHAAIKFGRLNKVSHIEAFPMSVQNVLFPSNYKIVLANSLVEAKKQAGARNIFNNRVAAYEFGLMMICKNFPQYAVKLEHLHDVNCENLGIDEAQIYRMIKSLPISVNRSDIMGILPEQQEEINHVFRSHDEPEEGYKIRQVCLYGVAECVRSGMAVASLQSGDMETFGQLISKSHDGDRVTKLADGKRVPVDNCYFDERIDSLIDDLESAVPERIEQARLWRQGGGYNVSIPELDILVDIALSTDGVIGAGLVGAGMGGSIAIIVESKCVQQLINNLAERYHLPRKLPIRAQVASPVFGLGTICL